MSKKHNQIGQQLHQGGITASQAQAIAKWLGSLIPTQEREITSDSATATNPDWLNEFKPPEEVPLPSNSDTAKEDGIWGNVNGSDKEDGKETPGYQPPSVGGDTIINVGGGSVTNVGIPFDPREIWARIARLEIWVLGLLRRVSVLEDQVKGLNQRMDSFEKILSSHSRMLEKHDKQIKAILKELEDAVECP